MEYYMIIKLKADVDAKELYEQIRTLSADCVNIEGIRKADVFLSSYRLKKRYDMMIRLRMKKSSLDLFKESEWNRKFKEDYGDKIESISEFCV